MKIVLVVVDTLRADHLGCYGYFRNTSPTIDQLAREGVLFLDAHATAIATGPAFTSIVTGLSPIHHGFYVTPFNIPNLVNFNDAIPTLAELIPKEKGYTTVAFDNLMSFLCPMKQLVRGFEYYINVSCRSNERGADLRGGRINSRLLPWIKQHAREDFFLFVHYWEPHTPYSQPEDYRHLFHHIPGNLSDLKVEKAPAGYSYVPGWGKVGELWESEKGDPPMSLDLYDGEIRYLDDLLKEVIETLKSMKILEETVIIVTSDHGEQLGQHGMYGHQGLNESVICIPLILWNPERFPQGKVIRGYVQQADIAPTILDLMGAEQFPHFDGESLIPLIMGEGNAREEIFVEDEEQRALLQGKWKYIRHYELGKDVLYNLQEDPVEIIDYSREYPQQLQVMSSRLHGWIKKNLNGSIDPLPEAIRRWRTEWKNFLGEPLPKEWTIFP
ncbi:hypothetical protein CEE34_09750 [Candidatus Aerophobetes bacterium Ae_b3a]|nr:MAG: hypothetical protein CEE34_09750 [Candidatus Aerophobetes bacterium Ae_b3a]